MSSKACVATASAIASKAATYVLSLKRLAWKACAMSLLSKTRTCADAMAGWGA
ncbi:hypothetical protein D3C76_872680 [compost metagenome]